LGDTQTPTLEDLREVQEPAWLWDWQASRIVWANARGLSYFGCETLFDLIDRPFDVSEPGVERISDIARKLRRGQSIETELFFPSTGQAAPVSVTCHVHALPDGRAGLLTVGRSTADAASVPAQILAQAFDSLPGSAVILAKDGSVRHANAAAARLLGPGAAVAFEDLVQRAELAGMASDVKSVETKIGLRDLRLTVRLLPDGGDAHAVALADDVTARRALEKQLRDVPAASAAPVQTGLSPQEADAFQALGQVLRSETDAVPAARPRGKIDLPAFIRSSLEAMPGASLFAQNGVLEYGSAAAATLLGFQDAEELMGSEALAKAVTALPPDAKNADLPNAYGETMHVAIEAARIAWRNGPAVRLKLTPAARPEEPAHTAIAPAPADDTETTQPPAPAAAEPPLPPPPAAQTAPLPPPTAPLPPQTAVPEAAAAAVTASPPATETLIADAELRAILDTASDGIITLDPDGRIMSFSAGAEAIFGYRSAEVRQKPFGELMTPDSRRTVRDYLAALQGPGLASVFNDGREVTAIVKQGGEVPLFLTISKLQPKAPHKAALCAVVRDITQWKKTEAELRAARDEAERASRQKSEFLANVSHELRTPLNAIIGFSEMMRMESFGEIENERYRSYVNDIHSSGSHLLSLINDLLDLSKVEAGKLELNFTSVNLAEVTEHALKLIQEQATQARVILRKALPADLPNVVADLRSMRQIMLNILSNAVKFTDPGGQVIISAGLTPEGELKLRVKDTGVGMSAQALAHALEPFRRVETEGREAPGTGLGLPLTKALAEANRTRFDISSEPGKGTTVEITFPTTRVLAA
jgi:PAS domain S-box-containing protein